MKYRFKTKPDPHQRDGLIQALKRRRYGIFFQQRVGKTKVGIDFCGANYLRGYTKNVLIVCPLSVRAGWMEQLDEHLDYPFEAHLYPRKSNKRQAYIDVLHSMEGLTFTIINYDLLHNEYLRFKNVFDTIIFDESHLLKSHNSKRSKAAWRIGKKADNVLLLTGTPLPQHPHDIFAQFRIMDESIYGTSWTKFKGRYCIMGGFEGRQIVNYRHVPTMQKKLAENSIRVLRKDVFDEIPPEFVIVPIEFEPKARKQYDELRKHSLIELDDMATVTADLAITRMMRLQQICGGFIHTDEGVVTEISTAKLKTLKDLVNTHKEAGEPVVIFYKYTAEGDAIARNVPNSMRIYGGASEEDRALAVREFQAGKLDAIIVQISTGAMGIKLDRAHINIFYSTSHRLSDFQQATDRVMGRDQKNLVTNYLLAIDKTIDRKILQSLKDKEDLNSSITDKWRWLLSE